MDNNSSPFLNAINSIRTAVIAGGISGTITLILSLIGWGGFNLYNLLDVGLIYGLSFGIYRKSRICAVILFIYFIASKIVVFVETQNFSGFPIALIFAYCFYRGIWGTFKFHKLKSPPVPSLDHQQTIAEGIAWQPQRSQEVFVLHLSIGKDLVLLPETRLMMGSIPGLEVSDPSSGDRAVAEVTRNPQQPSVLGLKNCSHLSWGVTTAEGKAHQIQAGKSIKLEVGTRITFAGSLVGEIRQP
jgi:hypothetical protein